MNVGQVQHFLRRFACLQLSFDHFPLFCHTGGLLQGVTAGLLPGIGTVQLFCLSIGHKCTFGLLHVASVTCAKFLEVRHLQHATSVNKPTETFRREYAFTNDVEHLWLNNDNLSNTQAVAFTL